MSVRLPVRNHGTDRLAVYIEPYPGQFWLEPGDELTIVAGDGVQFSLSAGPELTIWLFQDGDGHQVVLEYRVFGKDGVELPPWQD
ncbi:hypothetical protein M8C13_29305 [Crossiella sp. SN42]|uniref:hypothetical protein n=1 Tax=Crossiella sp. SN42 TaxID=2944808 RepID=UPI00207D4E4F|nr:hypothetical protein [Crossiella sp. SN42]MCO1579857.1 hypothetical protein [Crossiella sp. SN42]